ncbi:MAG: carboxypeptidase-like regulatory domain-containing protein [Vicinamibacterales bacterium]
MARRRRLASRATRRWLVAACAGGALTCGGGRAPGAPSSSGPPASGVAGTIVRVVDGTPIAGATIQVRDRSAVSSASGQFSLSAPVGAGQTISVFAPGYLRHDLSLAVGRSGLRISMIPDSQPFSLGFYRQFARNAHDSPLDLAAIDRWTIAPRFYIRTTVDDTGVSVPDGIVARIVTVIRRSVPELSAGRFEAAAIETGTVARPVAAGWVIVTFSRDLGGRILGQATVGGNSGVLQLRYDPEAPDVIPDDPRGCGDTVVSVAEHEITHTMGFRHTVNEPDDFHSIPAAGCTGAPRPEHVRYHAAVAYSRPPGNLDVDVDPLDAPSLGAPAGGRPAVLVSCGAELFGRR